MGWTVAERSFGFLPDARQVGPLPDEGDGSHRSQDRRRHRVPLLPVDRRIRSHDLPCGRAVERDHPADPGQDQERQSPASPLCAHMPSGTQCDGAAHAGARRAGRRTEGRFARRRRIVRPCGVQDRAATLSARTRARILQPRPCGSLPCCPRTWSQPWFPRSARRRETRTRIYVPKLAACCFISPSWRAVSSANTNLCLHRRAATRRSIMATINTALKDPSGGYRYWAAAALFELGPLAAGSRVALREAISGENDGGLRAQMEAALRKVGQEATGAK